MTFVPESSEEKPVLQWRFVDDRNGCNEWHDRPAEIHVYNSQLCHGVHFEVRVKPERKPEYWRSKETGNIYKSDDWVERHPEFFEPVEVEVKPWQEQ